MKILIISATEHEVKNLLFDFSKEIDFLITGIGSPKTIFKLSQLLINNQYDLILNLGIAGSFSNKYKLGDIVQVSSNCFADLGFETANSFIPLDNTEFSEKKNNQFTNTFTLNFLKQIPSVKSITVNSTSGSKATIEQRLLNFNADIESMEGAAVAYVCSEFNLPFIEIRSISNYIEERNKDKWNVPLAITNLNHFINLLLNHLLHK